MNRIAEHATRVVYLSTDVALSGSGGWASAAATAAVDTSLRPCNQVILALQDTGRRGGGTDFACCLAAEWRQAGGLLAAALG